MIEGRRIRHLFVPAGEAKLETMRKSEESEREAAKAEDK